MRIVIDLQGAQSESRFRGIGRYSLSLTQAILRQRGEHEVIVALNGMFPETIEPIRDALDGLILQQDIRVWYAPGPVKGAVQSNHGRSQVAELVRESFITSLKPDVVLITSLFDGFGDDTVTSIGEMPAQHLTVPILYDLIPLVQSDVYLKTNPVYERFYRAKLNQLKRADAWLTISDSSLNEAVEYLQLDPTRITNISGACDPVFHQLTVSPEAKGSLKQRFGLNESFVLYSGGADARKNLERLIRVYSQLPRDLSAKYQLVIAGKIPEAIIQNLRTHAKTCGIPTSRLIFTGSISDTDLCHLYNLCHAYVFPSLHEGFGLPVLEAMSCGAPVIASNTSSLPEVVGITQALFDPLNEQDMLAKLSRVLVDEDFRQQLIQHGDSHRDRYSWDACGERALAALTQRHSASDIELTAQVDTSEGKASPGHHATHAALIQSIGQLKPSMSDDELMRCASMIALNHPPARQKRLFVDISELVRHDAATGVQRVTRSILYQLLINPPTDYLVEPVYATTTELGYRRANKFSSKFLGADLGQRFNQADEIIESIPGDIFLGLDLQHQVTRYQSPYLSALRARGVAVYFVVYDLLPIQFPHFWPSSLGNAHAEWLQILGQFDGAICISKAVADELVTWRAENLPTPSRPYRVGWFHLGADIDNSMPSTGLPDDGLAVLEQLAARPTYLSVGTIEPRKAHHVTLAAFDELWAQGQDVNLVLVGKQGWLVDELVAALHSHPERGVRLFWLTGVSDEYLAKVYEASTCLVTASVGEGFGLPLIEAAQHNKPIIARDLPVFKEVAGDCATYFSGDASALALVLTQWLVAHRAGKTPDVSEMPWMTWEQSAHQLKQVVFDQQWMPTFVE
jgi:glycosyltransferase involved in cell wall biosynthesis